MKSNFQTILVAIFIFGAIAAVFIFSGVIPSGSSSTAPKGNVVIWGTLKSQDISPTIEEFNREVKTVTVSYVARNPSTFADDLVEALASGKGPDVIILPDTLISRFSDKIFAVPYTTIPERTFDDTFTSQSSIYKQKTGILGLPLTIDPLVLYYNRDMLESAGIVNPPKSWNELLTQVPSLVKKDASGNLIKSAIAFGTWSNVQNAKDIVSMLLMQVGNPITQKNIDDKLVSTLSSPASTSMGAGSPLALQFYTDFANPSSPSYSWNKALPNSRDSFIAADTAFYVGYASELFSIQSKNPNLNFNVAKIPQTEGTGISLTYGQMNAFSIMKSTKNPTASYFAVSSLSNQLYADKFAKALSLPSARRDNLAKNPTGSYLPIFFNSALLSRSWIDPNPEKTDQIFKEMIENINSGRLKIVEALISAGGQFSLLIRY